MRRGEGPKRESNLGSDPVWVAGKGGGGWCVCLLVLSLLRKEGNPDT